MLQCEICSKTFSSHSNLYQHHKIHSDSRAFVCQLCDDRKFRTSSHLRNHHQRVHEKSKPTIMWQPLTQKPTICASLKEEPRRNPRSLLKAFDKRKKQIEHSTVVEVDQMLPTISNSIQTQKGLLKSYKHQCSNCLKYFKEKSALTKHIRTHTGEKPYKCPCCPKAFADASNFKRHKMVHQKAANELEESKRASPKLLYQQYQHRAAAHFIDPDVTSISDPDPDGLELYAGLEGSSAIESSYSELSSDTVWMNSTTMQLQLSPLALPD